MLKTSTLFVICLLSAMMLFDMVRPTKERLYKRIIVESSNVDVGHPDPNLHPEPYFTYAPKNWTTQDLECLAQNIYFEARNQPMKGMIAVGLVTLNRVAHKRWPDTVCGVVKQHKQFSWFWDGKSDTPKREKAWDVSKMVAKSLLTAENGTGDFTLGATHYHADYVQVVWANDLQHTHTIGNHIFYR